MDITYSFTDNERCCHTKQIKGPNNQNDNDNIVRCMKKAVQGTKYCAAHTSVSKENNFNIIFSNKR